MYAAIRDAKDHINMETYSIEDDEVGRRFAAALIAKQKTGVQVNFIYDGIGSSDTPSEFFQSLRDGGIKVLEFNPLNPLAPRKKWQVGRDHRKLLVVDGQIAFVGGVNISSVYSSGSFRSKPPTKDNQPWRDTHLRLEGPSSVNSSDCSWRPGKNRTGNHWHRKPFSQELGIKGMKWCVPSVARLTTPSTPSTLRCCRLSIMPKLTRISLMHTLCLIQGCWLLCGALPGAMLTCACCCPARPIRFWFFTLHVLTMTNC